MITHYDLARPTLAAAPFRRPGWIFELKYDGFRCLAVHSAGEARLLTRYGNDLSRCFPEFARALAELPELALDGELVVVDGEGRPRFDQLARRARLRRPDAIAEVVRDCPAAIYAFDLLEFCGEDLRTLPLIRRKAILREALTRSKRIRYLDHVETAGDELFRAAEELGLEGVVAKRAESAYRAGRTRDWIKVKTAAGRQTLAQRASWEESR